MDDDELFRLHLRHHALSDRGTGLYVSAYAAALRSRIAQCTPAQQSAFASPLFARVMKAAFVAASRVLLMVTDSSVTQGVPEDILMERKQSVAFAVVVLRGILSVVLPLFYSTLQIGCSKLFALIVM